MTARTTCNSLQVATPLYRFIEDKVLPGTGIKSADFWKGFDEIVKDLTPKNEALLAKRDRLQLDLSKICQPIASICTILVTSRMCLPKF
jgi:malate synthase